MDPRVKGTILLCTTILVIGCATSGGRPSEEESYGVMVMAHGGTDEWNDAVLEAVEPLREDYPVEVAFGMADASTIQESVSRLEAEGVEEIGVVRLFVSGESWYGRTRQILGLAEGAPAREEVAPGGEGHGHEGHGSGGHGGGDSGDGGHHMPPFWRIDTEASFALSREGLGEADEMNEVLLERARSLSHDPAREDLLFLAHGPGDDDENERWIAEIGERTELLQERLGFRRVEVMTLREDWPEKREAAEERIRSFVTRAGEEDGEAIVIPYRVFGFGPYAEVLEGLDFNSNGEGLIPHIAVTHWLERQAALLHDGPFQEAID
jgi:hypothetical protein